jgi:hypothetical protein
MKKHLVLIITLVLPFMINAQDDELVITGTKKINKKLTPQQVIDSLNKHFPNAKSVQYYQAPAEVTNKGWNITEEDNLDPDAEVDYYTISFKQEGLKYYGLYNKDGTLLKSKVEQSVDQLPEPIRASLKNLSAQYPGYKVTSKTYFKNQNYSKSKEYYEVVASNGKEVKRLVYAPDGTILKDK